MIKSVLSLWLNDFFFFFVLGFGLSSIVRTRRHTSREVSGIGEISILDSAKEKERLKLSINPTMEHRWGTIGAPLGHHWGTIGARSSGTYRPQRPLAKCFGQTDRTFAD